MQPQIGALLTMAEGTSIVTEGIWDNRFRYVDELRRMGAQVQVDGKVAVFQGIDQLTAAPVKAVDLRAGAAMVIAGLAAQRLHRNRRNPVYRARLRGYRGEAAEPGSGYPAGNHSRHGTAAGALRG